MHTELGWAGFNPLSAADVQGTFELQSTPVLNTDLTAPRPSVYSPTRNDARNTTSALASRGSMAGGGTRCRCGSRSFRTRIASRARSASNGDEVAASLRYRGSTAHTSTSTATPVDAPSAPESHRARARAIPSATAATSTAPAVNISRRFHTGTDAGGVTSGAFAAR